MELSPEALDLYEFLTHVSFKYGLINIFTLDERLDFINNEDIYKNSNEFIENRSFIKMIQEFPRRIESPVLVLMTDKKGALDDFWKFTLGDPDPFPSIPHGHLKSNNKIKLDSYLGFTFNTANNNQPLKRETKEYIASLWNDEKFREFALKQINWFINKNPHYKWKVNHPVRLPMRKRKLRN
jgi:hypothetical protein